MHGVSKSRNVRLRREIAVACSENLRHEGIGAIYQLLCEKNQFDPRVFLTPIMDTVTTGNIPDESVAAVVECINGMTVFTE